MTGHSRIVSSDCRPQPRRHWASLSPRFADNHQTREHTGPDISADSGRCRHTCPSPAPLLRGISGRVIRVGAGTGRRHHPDSDRPTAVRASTHGTSRRCAFRGREHRLTTADEGCRSGLACSCGYVARTRGAAKGNKRFWFPCGRGLSSIMSEPAGDSFSQHRTEGGDPWRQKRPHGRLCAQSKI
jgi:hypothetical protein